MTMDENARFSLPRGATGFFRPEDGPLPETDRRAFHAGLYAAARLAGGTVGEVEPRAYPRTFHTASVIEEAGESIILCHAHHPWIVFVQERRSAYGEEFLAPPWWSSTFAHAGLEVLSDETLGTPLADVDTSVLTRSEWREVRLHGITTLGGVLFNAWD